MIKKFQPITWNDDMSVGIDIIDNDHKKLLSLVNEMDYILEAGMPVKDSAIASVLSELMDYTRYHFRREEIVMEVCDYPRIQDHKQAHKTLVGQVQSFVDGFNHKHPGFDPKILRFFMEDWLVEHIMKMDKDFAIYTEGKMEIIEKHLADR